MSMCQMPLLIKAAMKKEDYILLLKEASTRYRKTYLRKHYLFDGKYFTLDTCEMDSLEIYNEARLIAKYAEPTDDCVGLIFSKGCSFSFDDLYLKKDEYLIVRNESGNKAIGNGFSIRDKEKRYIKRKEDFLNSFPKPGDASDLTDADVENALMAEIKYNEYKCIGIEFDELDTIFRKYGHAMAEFNSYMGTLHIVLQNSKMDPCSILADYFRCNETYLFCNDGDQRFPSSIMILLYGSSK